MLSDGNNFSFSFRLPFVRVRSGKFCMKIDTPELLPLANHTQCNFFELKSLPKISPVHQSSTHLTRKFAINKAEVAYNHKSWNRLAMKTFFEILLYHKMVGRSKFQKKIAPTYQDAFENSKEAKNNSIKKLPPPSRFPLSLIATFAHPTKSAIPIGKNLQSVMSLTFSAEQSKWKSFGFKNSTTLFFIYFKFFFTNIHHTLLNKLFCIIDWIRIAHWAISSSV